MYSIFRSPLSVYLDLTLHILSVCWVLVYVFVEALQNFNGDHFYISC